MEPGAAPSDVPKMIRRERFCCAWTERFCASARSSSALRRSSSDKVDSPMQVQTSTPGPAASMFYSTLRNRAAKRSTPDSPLDGVATQNSKRSVRVPRSSSRIDAARARPTSFIR